MLAPKLCNSFFFQKQVSKVILWFITQLLLLTPVVLLLLLPITTTNLLLPIVEPHHFPSSFRTVTEGNNLPVSTMLLIIMPVIFLSYCAPEGLSATFPEVAMPFLSVMLT